jgi:hypothetical protein
MKSSLLVAGSSLGRMQSVISEGNMKGLIEDINKV